MLSIFSPYPGFYQISPGPDLIYFDAECGSEFYQGSPGQDFNLFASGSGTGFYQHIRVRILSSSGFIKQVQVRFHVQSGFYQYDFEVNNHVRFLLSGFSHKTTPE